LSKHQTSLQAFCLYINGGGDDSVVANDNDLKYKILLFSLHVSGHWLYGSGGDDKDLKI